MDHPNLNNLLEAQAEVGLYVQSIEDQARIQSLIELANEKGIQLGMTNYMKESERILKREARNLDTIYNFQPLMISDKIVPPVITETKGIIENPNNLTLKTTGQVYKIDKQARFSTRPPSWRDYIQFDISAEESTVQYIPQELKPRNENEKKIWSQTIKKSYEKGMKEGKNILLDSFDRLNKDYKGMILFHAMVIEGKLSMPAISSQSLAVSSSAEQVALNMELLKIQQLPSFNGNVSSWQNYSLKPETLGIKNDSTMQNNLP